MDRDFFVTVTGMNHYYGKVPFEIDRVIRLVKEPENIHDTDAIRAELPYIGTIGYVANSVSTVADGTLSAGRIYDRIGDSAYARILFVLHSSAVCYVLPEEETDNPEEFPDAAFVVSPEPQEDSVQTTAKTGKTQKSKIGFLT